MTSLLPKTSPSTIFHQIKMPKESKQAVLHTDIFMSIQPIHINNIASGLKNHEFRRYLLPASVRYIWFYVSAPVSAIRYVARISRGKEPGHVPEDGGLGNDDFNAGNKLSKFGYEILSLWKLREPIPLKTAKEKGILKGPPQKYTFLGKEWREGWDLQEEIRVIGGKEAEGGEEEEKREKGSEEKAKECGEELVREPVRISDFFAAR
jgi:hypothetical protein